MQIGRKIYFDKATGNVIQDTGEKTGDVLETSTDQDITTFKTLSERNQDTFDFIELPFGANIQDFAQCNGYRVNPTTKTLEFSYPIPGEPTTPRKFEKPLTEQLNLMQKAIDDLILGGGM